MPLDNEIGEIIEETGPQEPVRSTPSQAQVVLLDPYFKSLGAALLMGGVYTYSQAVYNPGAVPPLLNLGSSTLLAWGFVVGLTYIPALLDGLSKDYHAHVERESEKERQHELDMIEKEIELENLRTENIERGIRYVETRARTKTDSRVAAQIGQIAAQDREAANKLHRRRSLLHQMLEETYALRGSKFSGGQPFAQNRIGREWTATLLKSGFVKKAGNHPQWVWSKAATPEEAFRILTNEPWLIQEQPHREEK